MWTLQIFLKSHKGYRSMMAFTKALVSCLMAFCLIGCESREADPAATLASGDATKSPTSRPTTKAEATQTTSPQSPPSEPTLEDALGFIESKFTFQRIGGGTWSAGEIKLRGNPWTWNEVQTLTSGKDDLEQAFNKSVLIEFYIVDPRQLAYPVRVSENHLTFECVSGLCISVASSAARVLAPDRISHLGEARGSNTWHYSSPEDAARVANAMNHALRLLGASPAKF